MVMEFGKIGVILGGPSSEREISICSGKAISNALRNCGYTVVEIGENGPIEDGILTSGIDIAFIALHGGCGEDGTIQKFLEDTGIPYTGSGPLASKRALDKGIAKSLFLENGIPTPEYVLAELNDFIRDLDSIKTEIKNNFSFPVVVKPIDEGSSIGLNIVKREDQLKGALFTAYKYNKRIVIERYIPGSEITVGILGDAPLVVVHIVPKKGYYSYEAKYTSGMTEYIFPAKLSPRIYRQIQFLGLSAHNALGCRDFSRVDMRLDPDGRPWVLEVNTIPGFTETSLLPKSAKAVGIGFEELCVRILEMAWGRSKQQKIRSKIKI